MYSERCICYEGHVCMLFFLKHFSVTLSRAGKIWFWHIWGIFNLSVIYIANSWKFSLVHTNCGTTLAIRTINFASPAQVIRQEILEFTKICFNIWYILQMKEGESGTLEVVQSIQTTTTALHRVIIFFFQLFSDSLTNRSYF